MKTIIHQSAWLTLPVALILFFAGCNSDGKDAKEGEGDGGIKTETFTEADSSSGTCATDNAVPYHMAGHWQKAWDSVATNVFMCQKSNAADTFLVPDKAKWISSEKMQAFLNMTDSATCPSIRVYFAMDEENSCVYAFLSHVTTNCIDLCLEDPTALNSDSTVLVTTHGLTYFANYTEVESANSNWQNRMNEGDFEGTAPILFYTYERSSFENLLNSPDADILGISLTFGFHEAVCSAEGDGGDDRWCTSNLGSDTTVVDMILQPLIPGPDENKMKRDKTTNVNFAQPCPNFCPPNYIGYSAD